MRWRVALRLLGAFLLVGAATVVSLQVHVGGSGSSGRSCGSSLDVITDRSGWTVWFAQDTADATPGPDVQLLRTIRCPDAVNTRTMWAGVLAALGVAALLVASAMRPATTRTEPSGRKQVARIGRLGSVVAALGATLLIAGVVALGVLLADREAPMFVFVPRSVVAVIGLVVLTPVVALLVGGRALRLLARTLDEEEGTNETA